MADKKISALTAATTPLAGTEVLPIVQSGSTVKVANNDLRPKQIQSNATSGVLQVVGPAAAATRVMTVPDANFTAARTDATQTFTGAQTVQAAATQDAVALAGRAGGTGSYVATITPTTLSASRTVTLPDANTTVPVATQVLTFSGPSAARTITLPDADFTAARTDAAQTFTGLQTFATAKIINPNSGTYFTIENSDASIGGGESIAVNIKYTNYSSLSTDWQILSRYAGGNLQILSNTNNAGNVERLILESGGAVTPGADNAQTLGSSSVRWSVVYAATGTINTSDARAKQDALNISDAEKATALQIKGLLKSFRFKDAVAKKGDDARIHFGAVAQEVAQAFKDNGLDPEKYALFCYDKWDDKFEPVLVQEEYTDENGEIQTRSVETGEMRQTVWAGDRFGLRYEELLCFIVAAI